MSAGTRSLVLRHFAALRRQGLSADVALVRLVEGLPADTVRDDCLRAVRAMNSGAVVEDTAFISVLCNPKGTPEQAEILAQAFDAQQDADDALRSPTTLFGLAVAGPLLMLMCFGWFFPRGIAYSSEVPVLTGMVLDLAELMRYLGLPLVVAAVWGTRALRKMFAPGFEALSRAARMLAAATQPEKSVNFTVLNFTPIERQLLRALSARTSSSFAMRALAAELLREGRASVVAFRTLAPIIAFIGMLQVYGGLLLVLYRPIFGLAGSIQ